MFKRIWLVAAIVCVGALTVAAWIGLGPQSHEAVDITKTKPISKSATEENAADANYVMPGGAGQKAGESQTAKAPAAAKADEEPDGFNYGSTPAVALDANPQVKSVVEAIRDKKHPERLSTLIAPRPFDAQSFQADPTAYLNVIEPARAFQTAQPSPDVPRLRLASRSLVRINQGESAVLRVTAPAGAPVTFTSFDLGQFENQLTSITVRANEQGVAETRFIASPGTIEDVHILAGSPMASGQARITVNVRLPQGSGVTADASSPALQGALSRN